MAEVLPNLEKLEILRLENFSWHSKDVTPLLSVFARLTKLVLKNPKQVVVDKDFIIQVLFNGWLKRVTQ